MKLRDYQIDLYARTVAAWNSGADNVLTVAPTGAGKTVIAAHAVREFRAPTIIIAHRQELVIQLSTALAREGVHHNVIAPRPLIRLIVSVHRERAGANYFDTNAPVSVAGVDTLGRRDGLDDYLRSVRYWVMDEAHHILRDNKWGSAIARCPNARGLGFTATPLRADGKGLGRHADGVFDALISGVNMRDLIRQEWLSEYDIYCPPNHVNLTEEDIGASGEYKHHRVVAETRRAQIVGDVVGHYDRLARGKRGVTFAVSVEHAGEIAAAFNASGTPAAVVHAKTPDHDRVSIIRRFERGELLQLVNVDIFGEGFDLPAITVCSMARCTQSYPLYVQMFGRALRIMEGKERAIIIDHVGNVIRHAAGYGLPDTPPTWTLDARERKRNAGEISPFVACPACTRLFERVYRACPYCGFVKAPADRSAPEHVDGDLELLDPARLDELRRLGARRMMSDQAWAERVRGLPYPAQAAQMKHHRASREAQETLRETIAWWAGIFRGRGEVDSMIYRRFYGAFGVDVATAQTLTSRDAIELTERIGLDMIGRI